ncbi:MAG: CDP-alcohol phosphatidyltransferase family protein [Chloroflexi bacterium]|nr:CDP-alcohol phosphatidyltransferase family protein [Chloroflexota bacterium]
MIGERLRKWTYGIVNPVAQAIARTGISPNALTLTGFVMHIGIAYVLSQGWFFWGALLIVFAGIFDALDGAVARAANRVSRFGAFLDSNLDRFSEALMYFGLLLYYIRYGTTLHTILIYAAIIGSLMVSYARARAEGIGVECKEGMLTRFERIAILVLALLLDVVPLALWVLAILTNVTAFQRMYFVWRKTEEKRD